MNFIIDSSGRTFGKSVKTADKNFYIDSKVICQSDANILIKLLIKLKYGRCKLIAPLNQLWLLKFLTLIWKKVIIMCCDMGWFFVFGKILNHFIVLERDF